MNLIHLLKTSFVILSFTLCNIGHCDRLQFIDAPKSLFGSKDPTTIYTFTNPNARATIIFFPGGEGSFKINDNIKNHRGQPRMLQMIADAGYNVVFVDSPYPLTLSGPDGYPAMRDSSDHLDRIDSVLKHHQGQNLPIWLMGHSNGSFTVSAFVRRLQKENRIKEVGGIILSGTRNVVKFQRPLDINIVFVHHEKDACVPWTPYQDATNTYNKVKSFNQGPTTFLTITGGSSQSNNPCHTGYHMYNEAYPEVVQSIVSKLP
jgi:alpha-beta hydrolase superfamily lysophospholipase